MDKCSRLFLENIALADIFIIIVKVVPRTLVLVFDNWELGITFSCFLEIFYLHS